MITIYVDNIALRKADENYDELESVAKREVAIGTDYINVNTFSDTVVDRVVAWLGKKHVKEIAR